MRSDWGLAEDKVLSTADRDMMVATGIDRALRYPYAKVLANLKSSE
jgi:hypothetical protein